MLESLKHTLYAGLGATVVTAEKIEAGLQDLVDRGKLNADEARDAARKISEESKREFKEAQGSLEKNLQSVLEKTKVATHKDIAAINKRLDKIEKALSDLASPSDS